MRARDYRIDDLSESFRWEDRSERAAGAHLDRIEKFDLEITRIVKSDRNPPETAAVDRYIQFRDISRERPTKIDRSSPYLRRHRQRKLEMTSHRKFGAT